MEGEGEEERREKIEEDKMSSEEIGEKNPFEKSEEELVGRRANSERVPGSRAST
jgi:hypothetical protein